MIRPTPRAEVSNDWTTPQELEQVAVARMRQGLAPPAQIYQIPYRSNINWADFPDWARPLDPEAFDGCCHEG